MLKKFFVTISIVLALVLLLVPISCSSPSAEVMTGSSQIASAMRDIVDGKLEVTTVIPPGMCPGHMPGGMTVVTSSFPSTISRIALAI